MIRTTSLILYPAFYYSNNRNDFYSMIDWIKHYGGNIDPGDNNIITFSEEDYVAFKLIYGSELKDSWHKL